MSLREYLDFFHSAVGRIDDYGFAESIDINEVTVQRKKLKNQKKDLTVVFGKIFNFGAHSGTPFIFIEGSL